VPSVKAIEIPTTELNADRIEEIKAANSKEHNGQDPMGRKHRHEIVQSGALGQVRRDTGDDLRGVVEE